MPFAAITKADQTQLPDGEGKELVQQVCSSSCHNAWMWSDLRLDKEGWANEVQDMAEMMVEPRTSKELDLIIGYLAKNFGPESVTEKVNVNKATAKELESSLSLSSKDADSIVRYRQKNGAFKNWDDLKQVPELDAKKLEAKKDRLVY